MKYLLYAFGVLFWVYCAVSLFAHADPFITCMYEFDDHTKYVYVSHTTQRDKARAEGAIKCYEIYTSKHGYLTEHDIDNIVDICANPK